MGLALRLFLLLLLAVALPARAARAAPVQARGAGELARKVSPASWLHEEFQPLKPPAGVPAGRTFQAPFLAAAHKPSSHRRGPPRGRNKPGGDSKSLEASKHLDRTLSDLERRREMEGEAVLKAQFPGGSRSSLAASAAGREAMAGTVTGDWDRDFHHLETLVKNGLRMLELGEDVSAGKASQGGWMEDEFEPLGASAHESIGRTLPASLLVNARKPSSDGWGPQNGENQDKGPSNSLETAKHLDQMLSDLERRREMKQKSFRKAALPGGINGPVPATDTGSEEMPDSATEDVVTEEGIYAPDPVRLPRIICPQDVRRKCMIGTVVTVFTVPLLLLGCYLGIRKLALAIRRAFYRYLV